MERQLPVAVVCRVLGAPRSTVYARRARSDPLVRPGPATSISDPDLLGLIHQVLAGSPFAGEGYRKVRARLRREHGIRVGGKRVLRLLGGAGLLAPQRVRGRRKPRPHDGTIIPAAHNQRWGTDATMAWTRSDGWVWVFACVDHYTAEAWAHTGTASSAPALLAVAAGGPRTRAALGAALGLPLPRAPRGRTALLPSALFLARRPTRLAAGLHGGLADLLGRLGGGLAHLLDRRTGGLAHLLGCLPCRLPRVTTGEATKRLLGDVADLGGTADHAARFAVVGGS
jgi:hypothetical protein